jgi:RNA polymerase sigma factor (sigma-70 family)
LKLPSLIKGWLTTDISPKITPERLLSRYRATNNVKYLSLLVAQFNQALYHYLLSQSDKTTAEDVLQTTWLKVIKSQNSEYFNELQKSNVKGWLFTIARNTLIDECRRQKKWLWLELSDECASTSDLLKQIEANDKLTRFNIAITALPFYQREALIFQQEGFSLMDICQLTNENFETVKSRLRYAKQSLKTCLEGLS